jgi:FtsZ-binding cell division protein ZapB
MEHTHEHEIEKLKAENKKLKKENQALFIHTFNEYKKIEEERDELKKELHNTTEKFKIALDNCCHNCINTGNFCNGCYSGLPDHLKTDTDSEDEDE